MKTQTYSNYTIDTPAPSTTSPVRSRTRGNRRDMVIKDANGKKIKTVKFKAFDHISEQRALKKCQAVIDKLLK